MLKQSQYVDELWEFGWDDFRWDDSEPESIW